jgi:class 3 adenylate cyclase
VAGREFPYETLALLSEHGEDALLHLIEEALEARVIEEMAGAGRYRFTHALMQETLLGELSTTRRVRIHARVGEALERRWGQRADERAARLAVHFVEAAMLSPEHARKAVHYAKLAAEQAEAQSAWDDAARHYEHCLTLVTEAEDALGEDEAALLTSLGVCQRNDAQMRAAWRALMRAIAVSKARDDPMGVARATLGAVGIPAPPGRIDQLLGEAMDLLGDTDPYLQARLILGRTLFSAALESAQLRRVEQILEKHESPDIRAALSFERGMLALTDLRFDDVWPEFDRAYDGLKKHGRVHEVGFILFIRGILPLMLGDLVLGKAAAEDSLRHAREVHSVLWEVNILLRLAGLALALGRREDFDTLMDQVVPNYGRDLLLVAQAELTGDLHRAQSLLPQIDATGGVPSWVAHVHAARARLRLHAGDNDTAIAEISAFKAALGTVQRHRFSTVRYFPILEADDALVLLGESDAQSIYEELCDCAPLRWDPLTLPGADRMRGALALRLGLVDEAVAHLHDGLGWSEREGLWLEAGRCLQGLAEVAARGNDRREALRLLDRAAALFRAYGAKLYLDQVIAKKLDLQGLTGSSIYASIDAIADSVQQERPDVSLHAAPDGTVTIMFGDIEGSTPLNQRLGDARYTALLGEYAALVRSAVEGRSGRVVKHIGDGFMAVFPQPHDALRCAVALQASVAAHGFAEPVRVRCGVHAGSPVREGADFFGVDVTLASRITARALGGEVVVSSAVRDRVGGSGEFAFDAGQDVSLKGLTGVHRLFRAATPH